MKAIALYLAAAIAVAAAGGYVVRHLAPSSGDIQEARAYAAANNRMMAGMSGTGAAYSGNPDHDFVMLMIPHHQGAVDMAEVELKYGTDPKIRTLAQEIVAEQREQIDQMSQWMQQNRAEAASATDPAEEREAFSAATDKMMKGMMSLGMTTSGNADLDFVRMMIPHHQGAIDMGQVELRLGKDPMLRQLSQQIISAQQGQIEDMSQWLKARGH